MLLSVIKVISIPFISMEQDFQKSIYLLDCIWEIFVMVGKEARSNKEAIRFALDVGMVYYNLFMRRVILY